MKPSSNYDRCTANDCQQLFATCHEQLRWLCYTLTGHEELRDRVLEAALAQTLKGADHVFREWMVSWTRRLIVKACIAVMQPADSKFAQAAYPLPPVGFGAVSDSSLAGILSFPSEILQRRLLGLDALSRFVFVLRAMEGYSRRETSLLLDIDDRACEWTYVWATKSMMSDLQAMTLPWTTQAHNAELSLAQAGD